MIAKWIKTVSVGLLHSLTGSMAISERPLVDAISMAVDEINTAGGVMGYKIEPIVEDGASSPDVFKDKAQMLFHRHNITNVFGCWTSSARKAVMPVIEANDGLLWYPAMYEGLEESKHIVYSGGCLNQQIEPALDWAFTNKCSRFFLIGADNVFCHTANLLARVLVEDRGGEITAEQYTHSCNTDFAAAIERIWETKPDIILNTLDGDGCLSFFKQYHKAGISIPVLSASVSEEQIQAMAGYACGHYACQSYFQSLDINENHTFIDKFRTKYGRNRVISDTVVSAYCQIYLWKQAVEDAASFDAPEVRANLHGQRFLSPAGYIRVEPNNHIMKKAYVGLIGNHGSGQIQIVWNSLNSIRPKPWLGVEEEAAMRPKNLLKNALGKLPQVIHDKMDLNDKAACDERTLRRKAQLLIQRSKLSTMGEMLNNIVHQWKQPLNAIALKVQDISDAYAFGQLDAKYINDLVEVTMGQIEFMSKTLDEFRDFSLPSKTKQEFDVQSAIEELLSMFLDVYRMQNIDICLKVEQDAVLTTKGHPNEFKQVVLNILNNSKDAALTRVKSGLGVSGRIEINISNTEDKSLVVIAIRDNGGGIPDDIIGKIFEAYFTTKDNEGTGIGLSMSKRIIETNMGGSLTARNITGGAEFVISLNTVTEAATRQKDSGAYREPKRSAGVFWAVTDTI